MSSAHGYTQSQLNAHKAAQERSRRAKAAADRIVASVSETHSVSSIAAKERTIDAASVTTSVSFLMQHHVEYAPYGVSLTGGQTDNKHRFRTMYEIASDVVSQYDGISVDDIRNYGKDVRLRMPRHHVVHAILSERPDVSQTKLGNWLGGRDRTTILHSYRQWENRLKRENENACNDTDAGKAAR